MAYSPSLEPNARQEIFGYPPFDFAFLPLDITIISPCLDLLRSLDALLLRSLDTLLLRSLGTLLLRSLGTLLLRSLDLDASFSLF